VVVLAIVSYPSTAGGAYLTVESILVQLGRSAYPCPEIES
jgi:hypothetical protein